MIDSGANLLFGAVFSLFPVGVNIVCDSDVTREHY